MFCLHHVFAVHSIFPAFDRILHWFSFGFWVFQLFKSIVGKQTYWLLKDICARNIELNGAGERCASGGGWYKSFFSSRWGVRRRIVLRVGGKGGKKKEKEEEQELNETILSVCCSCVGRRCVFVLHRESPFCAVIAIFWPSYVNTKKRECSTKKKKKIAAHARINPQQGLALRRHIRTCVVR